MKFEIKRSKNGIILEVENNGEKNSYAYQEPEYQSERLEFELFHEFLYLITEAYGPHSSKYDKYIIRTIIDHGNKYDCEDPECDICKYR